MSIILCYFTLSIKMGGDSQGHGRVDSNTPIPQLTNTYIFLLYKLYLFQIPHILFGSLTIYTYLTYYPQGMWIHQKIINMSEEYIKQY